jgi:hypothetical protein
MVIKMIMPTTERSSELIMSATLLSEISTIRENIKTEEATKKFLTLDLGFEKA